MKVCQRCGVEYSPTGNYQKYCPGCVMEAYSEINNAAHRERRKRQSHHGYKVGICQRCGKEYQRKMGRQKLCGECGPIVQIERVRLNSVSWEKVNKEKRKVICAKNHKAHPETMRKVKAKHRQLGFHPLNSPFLDCEGHHINPQDVIYEPKQLHRSVRHNIWAGKGMVEANVLAGAFLTEDWT